MQEMLKSFREYRSKMNKKILGSENKVMKRIYSLDTLTYQDGALSGKVKEMLGLATSMVLRCDDCVKYHLERSHEEGLTKEEVMESLGIATLIGGTIMIPHLRRAYEYWEALEAKK